MNHELICRWLDLPDKDWPPDHYRLLGLPAGEADVHQIEQRVHERLATVRPNQLAHPEQATEAMNRLAQAFVCLTDPKAKAAYDAQFLSKPVPTVKPVGPAPARRPASQAQPVPPVPSVAVVELPPTSVPTGASPDPLAWLYGPWTGMPGDTPPPSRTLTEIDLKPTEPDVPLVFPIELPAPGSTMLLPPPVPVLPAMPATPAIPTSLPAEPVDPLVETARSSTHARRGLGTKRGLYHRIARTRELLCAWEQAGKYFKVRRKLSRRSEAADLIRQLNTIRELVREFPPILGRAGQPGYLVMALARQQMIVQTFQSLLPSQREVLARDWEAGYTLLTAHRQFLRQELRHLRRKSWLGQGLRVVRAVLNEHPGWILLVLALAALFVALYNTAKL
jgi:hypothetical protein